MILIEHEQSARQITANNTVSFKINFELILIFKEKNFIKSIYFLNDLDIFKLIHKKIIINTEKIRAEDLSELKKENKEIIVYLGRPTCSYCRSFVKLLNKSIKETNSKVYYIQTEKDSTNKALASIRKEYNIEYIPTLIKIKEIGRAHV